MGKELFGDAREARPDRLEGLAAGLLLVVLFGFLVLGILAYRTYQADPPIPARVVDPSGRMLFTSADIRDGQRVFLRNGLMEYGSIFGHGAYLGPDFTDDYLHRAAQSVRRQYGRLGADAAQAAHDRRLPGESLRHRHRRC